jgi:inhibitor of cysteine peptidase
MVKLKISLFAVLFMISTIAFGADPKIVFTSPDKPIMVDKSSATFSIILESNPTTGYSWFLVKYDSNLIVPVSRKYYPSNTKLIGAGGYEKWTFRIKPMGFVVPQVIFIQLAYVRPWNLENYKPITFKVVTYGS